MTQLNSGTLDPNFGIAGIKRLEPHGNFFRALGLARAGDGQLLVAGTNQGSDFATSNFVLMKLDNQGNRVKSFATNGVVEDRFTLDASLSSIGLKALILEDSTITLVGQFNNGTTAPLPGIAQFLATGQFDTSYGDQGTHVVRTSLIPEYGASANPVIDGCRQSDGALVTINPHVAGPELSTALIVKTHADGTPANDFNARQGYIDTQQRGGEETTLNAIAADEHDKILVCGYTKDVRGSKTGIVLRFQADGAKDNGFAVNGALRSTELNFDYLQPYGDRILCCGSTKSGEALIVQLDLDGNPLHAPSITPAELSIRWIKVVWHENRILALGEQQTPFGVGTVIARFNERGILDRSFGKDGTGCTPVCFEEESGEPEDIVLDELSRIFVLASVKQMVGSQTCFLACLLN